MHIIVNGKPMKTATQVVKDLVREQAGADAHVAVVLNDCVVPAAAHATMRLNTGDRIELLTFAGGG